MRAIIFPNPADTRITIKTVRNGMLGLFFAELGASTWSYFANPEAPGYPISGKFLVERKAPAIDIQISGKHHLLQTALITITINRLPEKLII